MKLNTIPHSEPAKDSDRSWSMSEQDIPMRLAVIPTLSKSTALSNDFVVVCIDVYFVGLSFKACMASLPPPVVLRTTESEESVRRMIRLHVFVWVFKIYLYFTLLVIYNLYFCSVALAVGVAVITAVMVQYG